MPIHFSRATMTILQSLLGYPWPDKQIEEPGADATRAHEADYVHRAGYILGANGEWIAELATKRHAKH